ncbi:Nephronectin Preosteoblast EGF-like repeat protein with MAM domain [Triplophysa tibetana]|uniref:Nephronectin Preosteoblast EGF-like repeat protein with MAM domain n=1 Tax=Triplophysa tibetana TaxID=1572043 RepID=A0A5A9NAZ2_9TELE|nr:Nephronectin Preosteoblast EGF-like repeat protein with MAM domain [Triplophysa tibetana]
MANCQYSCAVMKGQVTCQCPSPGLRLSPDGRTCVDVDECVTGQAKCPRFRKCVNTFGSYICRCHDGFELKHINGKYHCTDKKNLFICYDKLGHKKCKCKASVDGKGYDCKAVVKVTIEPARPVKPTTPSTTTGAMTTTTRTFPVSTTTINPTTAVTMTTAPPTTTVTSATVAMTTAPPTTTVTFGTVAITTAPTTSTVTSATVAMTTAPPTTTVTSATVGMTTAPPTSTVTSATVGMTTAAPTTTLTSAVTVAMTSAAATTTTLTTTVADTTHPPTETSPATTITMATTAVPVATTSMTTAGSTTTLDNRIHRDTPKPRGDVHIPRYEHNLFDWDFDVELGNTAEYTHDDPGAGAVSCTFDEGLCVWMSDSGDLHWNIKEDPAGGQYLTVPDATSRRSIRGARLTLPLAPPMKAWRSNQLCLSFRHRLHGHHIGSLQVFVRKGRSHSPSVWTSTGGHGWKHAQIPLWGRGLDDIVLKGERRRGKHGEIAVDDLSLRRGACAAD